MKDRMGWFAVVGIVLVASLWLAYMIMVNYPGIATTDTIRQLNEGVSGCYTNWKPTLYSWLLGAFERGVSCGGVAAAFVLQLVFFALAVSGITWYYVRRNIRYVLLILVLPLFFTVKGMLITSVGNDEMAAACYLFFIAAVLLVVDLRRNQRVLRWLVIGGAFVVLGYGLLMRHNALPAVMVLVCWAFWRLGIRKIWHYVLGCLFFAVSVYTFNGIMSYHVLKAEPSYPLRSPLVDDVVNLSILDGHWHSVVHEFYKESLQPPYVRCVYAPESGNWNSPINPYLLHSDIEQRRRDYELLKVAWWEMVRQHPERYLLTKAFFFHQFLLEGRVVPWLCEALRNAYPHIRIHMEEESSSWRAWVNREFVVMSCIPLMCYVLVISCLFRNVRQWVCAMPERTDALMFMLVAFMYTGTFVFMVLSATEQRYYVIRASLCCVGAALLFLSMLGKPKNLKNAA